MKLIKKGRLGETASVGLNAQTVQKRNLSTTGARALPSHELVPLPALSPTMETGTIKQWEVKKQLFIYISREMQENPPKYRLTAMSLFGCIKAFCKHLSSSKFD